MAETNTKMCQTSLIPKVLFAVDRIKSKSALRNTECEGAWQIEVSSLFHSLIVQGKNDFSIFL